MKFIDTLMVRGGIQIISKTAPTQHIKFLVTSEVLQRVSQAAA